jgi:omega-6 fatty acid desaturase (delta-12 desaturase)
MKGKGRPPLNDLSEIDKEDFPFQYEQIYEPPAFTIKELRDAIPPHLFERTLWKSSLYALVNLIAIGVLFYLATFIDSLPRHTSFLLWPLYWWFQGVAGVGIWILAHEAGHQAFSDSKRINTVVGFVLHTLVLVPYHSWRISHSQHHAGTAHTGHDQAYVPRKRSEYRPNGDPSPWQEAFEESPIYSLGLTVIILLFGWPAYFFLNMSGQSYPGRYPTHIMPSSPIFQPRHRWQVLASDLGIVVWLSILSYLGWSYSFSAVVKYYVIPYLIVNAWLITITLLQHTDVYLPHYSPQSWNFIRGALATVDRDYGWFLNHAFHHIHDSHVAHHLFSQMPFYNAIKATPYLKEKLGEYYFYDQTPVWKALWRAVKRCKFVENTGDILFYRK